MALAYAHYMEHQDSEAVRDVDRASHCPFYNDHSIDVARGWQRLLDDTAPCMERPILTLKPIDLTAESISAAS